MLANNGWSLRIPGNFTLPHHVAPQRDCWAPAIVAHRREVYVAYSDLAHFFVIPARVGCRARGIPGRHYFRRAITRMRNRRCYYVYIMSSLSRTIYTGVTNNLESRVAEHKEPRPASFTARYKIDRLVYFEEFDSISEAIVRESEIKQMARRTKIALIESTNPEWRDLIAE